MSTEQSVQGPAETGRDTASVAAASSALSGGPKGALLISAIAVALLFIGWLAFYFLLFMPRGPIG